MAKPKVSIKKKKKVNPKWELFCIYYTSHPNFGNATRAYAKAFGKNLDDQKQYNTSRTEGYKLLTIPYILKRINELLNDVIMNDATVDTQLALLIFQQHDFSAKLGAIREFNKLKGRIDEKLKLEFDPVKEILEKFGIKEGEDIGELRTTEETTPQDKS